MKLLVVLRSKREKVNQHVGSISLELSRLKNKKNAYKFIKIVTWM